MALEERKVKRYPSVEYCIYCGKSGKETKLTEEHIFPYALCGTLVLSASSCIPCARHINSYIEQPLLERDWAIIRARLDTWTRNPKNRSDTFTCKVFVNGKETTATFRVAEYPTLAITFNSRPPGLLSGVKGVDGYEEIRTSLSNTSTGHSLRGIQFEIKQRFTVGLLDLLMAKIAHSYAVAEGYMNEFEPLLPGVILGTVRPFTDYIGANDFSRDALPKQWFTGATFNEIHLMPLVRNGEVLLIALIQTFGGRCPIFQVVVGRGV
jgi:hypothetical protein